MAVSRISHAVHVLCSVVRTGADGDDITLRHFRQPHSRGMLDFPTFYQQQHASDTPFVNAEERLGYFWEHCQG